MIKKSSPQTKIDNIKLPPQNIEAEINLLGAILLDKEVLIQVLDEVSSDDFYQDKHQVIFQAILDLFEKKQPIDLLTLSSILKDQKHLKNIGGVSYLTTLVNAVATSAHAKSYAKIVHHKSVLRRLLSTSREINELSYDEDRPLEDVLDEAEKQLFTVSQKHLKRQFTSIKSVLIETFERFDEMSKDNNRLRGLTTGFGELDKITNGLQKSDLIIIAARPSMGKTSFALDIIRSVAIAEGLPVGFFSLEMSKEQLVDRLLASQAKIDLSKIRSNSLEESDFEKLNIAMGILNEAPIYIDDSPMTNIMEMRAKARRLQLEKGLGLIVVDYLQLMSGRNQENRVQEVSDISRGLKALAREVDVPVIALSQLSRSVENRSPQIPQLADLRESGSIEQDADAVMFIYREDYYNSETDRQNIADILIKKHRNGPTGEIELFWNKKMASFSNLSKRAH